MISEKTCAFCSAKIKDNEFYCQKCGTFDQSRVNDESRFSVLCPKTIAELKLYCQEHRIPNQQIGFFINEDIIEPYANGIYTDEGRVIVYENLHNGFRNTGYEGVDEAAAVSLFFAHMMDTCHEAGIHPERYAGKDDPAIMKFDALTTAPLQMQHSSFAVKIVPIVVVAVILIVIYALSVLHGNDGYYGESGMLFYKNGRSWYYYSGGSWNKYVGDTESLNPEFFGESYDPAWGAEEY